MEIYEMIEKMQKTRQENIDRAKEIKECLGPKIDEEVIQEINRGDHPPVDFRLEVTPKHVTVELFGVDEPWMVLGTHIDMLNRLIRGTANTNNYMVYSQNAGQIFIRW